MPVIASGVREPVLRVGGFTLIETVITLVVLSIAAVGVLSVFTAGISGSTNPLIIDQATQLAQGELDAVIGLKQASGFSAPLATGTNLACKTPPAWLLPGFNCTLDICYVAPPNLDTIGACLAAPTTSYKRVAVTITNSAIGSVTAVTLLTDY